MTEKEQIEKAVLELLQNGIGGEFVRDLEEVIEAQDRAGYVQAIDYVWKLFGVGLFLSRKPESEWPENLLPIQLATEWIRKRIEENAHLAQGGGERDLTDQPDDWAS
ncbi:MAG: hypothetical protein F4100_02580 [Rhodothermaceae bacterium]|nr:hypothetical protein [Rhodothermaceae bacterium]MYE63678.1 hypothetical protein [Rhodothermaceae bacterium]MYJ19620.1 hypothetical protein [Rhodothermaceae bacterium]